MSSEPRDQYLAVCDALQRVVAARDALRHALMELRVRYHAAGRRPEECYEMSLIDAALAAREGK